MYNYELSTSNVLEIIDIFILNLIWNHHDGLLYLSILIDIK